MMKFPCLRRFRPNTSQRYQLWLTIVEKTKEFEGGEFTDKQLLFYAHRFYWIVNRLFGGGYYEAYPTSEDKKPADWRIPEWYGTDTELPGGTQRVFDLPPVPNQKEQHYVEAEKILQYRRDINYRWQPQSSLLLYNIDSRGEIHVDVKMQEKREEPRMNSNVAASSHTAPVIIGPYHSQFGLYHNQHYGQSIAPPRPAFGQSVAPPRPAYIPPQVSYTVIPSTIRPVADSVNTRSGPQYPAAAVLNNRASQSVLRSQGSVPVELVPLGSLRDTNALPSRSRSLPTSHAGMSVLKSSQGLRRRKEEQAFPDFSKPFPDFSKPFPGLSKPFPDLSKPLPPLPDEAFSSQDTSSGDASAGMTFKNPFKFLRKNTDTEKENVQPGASVEESSPIPVERDMATGSTPKTPSNPFKFLRKNTDTEQENVQSGASVEESSPIPVERNLATGTTPKTPTNRFKFLNNYRKSSSDEEKDLDKAISETLAEWNGVAEKRNVKPETSTDKGKGKATATEEDTNLAEEDTTLAEEESYRTTRSHYMDKPLKHPDYTSPYAIPQIPGNCTFCNRPGHARSECRACTYCAGKDSSWPNHELHQCLKYEMYEPEAYRDACFHSTIHLAFVPPVSSHGSRDVQSMWLGMTEEEREEVVKSKGKEDKKEKKLEKEAEKEARKEEKKLEKEAKKEAKKEKKLKEKNM